MPGIGKEEHETLLQKTISEFEADGWRVVDLKGKSPDAVAAKDGKLIAIEILGVSYRPKRGWQRKWTYKKKREIYSMFDDVVIKVFKRTRGNISGPQHCEFKGCSEKITNTEKINGILLSLCEKHMQQFKVAVKDCDKTESMYWAIDNLTRRASEKWKYPEIQKEVEE